MTETPTNFATDLGSAEAVVKQADAIVAQPSVQPIVAKATSKLSPTIRKIIYKATQFIGVAVTVGTAAQGILHGQPADYVGSAVGVLVVAQALIAELHITK